MRKQRIIAAGGVGALLATLALLVLALLPRPPFGMDQAAILSGRTLLNPGEASLYLTYLTRNLTVDSFYLLGHMAMWLGYAQLLSQRKVRFATLIGLLGLMSGMLDLLENEVRWALAGLPGDKYPVAVGWSIAWQVIVGMSFWAVLVTIGLTAVMIWGPGRLERLVSLVGLLSLLSIGSIYASGYLVTFICMIAWHGVSGIYLWHAASDDGTTLPSRDE